MSEEIRKKQLFLVRAAYAGVVLLLCLAGWYLACQVKPLWIAVLLAMLIHPLAKRLEKKVPLKKKVLATIVLALVYLLLALLIAIVAGRCVSAAGWAAEIAPVYYRETLRPALDSLYEKAGGFLPDTFTGQLDSYRGMILNWLQGALSNSRISVGEVGGKIVSGSFDFLVTILLSFFVCLEYDRILAFLKSILPEKTVCFALEIKELTKVSLIGYIKSLMIMLVITFFELVIGLGILHTPWFVLSAAGIALLDALPVFGVGTVLIPWSLLSLVQGRFGMAAGLMILYIVILIMRNVLQPKVIGDQLDMNPVVALIAIYLGGKFGGIIGMILLTVVFYIVQAYYMKEKHRLIHGKPESEL